MTAARALEVARRELGTAETPVNRQKYGRAYGWDGVAWCAQFAWWVLTQAGDAALVPKTASTVVMRDWYRKRGQWHMVGPRPGDLVFFRFPGNSNPVNHVGIVEAVEAASGTLITIEGNTAGTNAGDQRNGGMVARKRRLSSIVGYARPAYAIDPPKPAAPPAPPKPRPREDECMLIKTQPDKSKPVYLAGILSGFNFVGLGASETPSDKQAADMGLPVVWVEYGTYQEFDRRSHVMLGDDH